MKILAFIVLLGVLIFVHELGHFLVAKAFRIKVLRFSLGFGPRIVGFRRGETEYRVSLLPLGGYVKMAGDDPSETIAPEDRGRGYLEQRPYKRLLVALAGPAMNLVFPVLAYFVVFAGQTQGVAAHVGQVIPGMPAAEAGLRPGDDIIAVDGEQVVSFQDLQRLVSPAAGRPLEVTARRDGRTLTVTMTPRRYDETDPIETVPVGKIGIAPHPSAPVIGVTGPETTAFRAGLRPLDRVQSVAGAPVVSLEDALGTMEAAHARGAPFEVLAVRERPLAAGPATLSLPEAVRVTVTPDPASPLGVESGELYLAHVTPGSPVARAGLVRGDRLVSADGATLRSWEDVNQLRQSRNEKPFQLGFVSAGQEREVTIAQAVRMVHDEVRGQDVPFYVFGATGGVPGLPPPVVSLPFRPLLAAHVAAENTWDVTRKMVIGLGMLVTGQIAFSNVGGPLQIYDITAKAAEQGWEVFLHVMALISINLGLMNLLPVPVLDGGHMVQAGIEMVRRQPLSLRTREVANLVGLVLLVSLMLFALRNDVVRFFLPG